MANPLTGHCYLGMLVLMGSNRGYEPGLITVMASWERMLSGANHLGDPATLERDLVRDLLIAAAAGSTGQALAGAEALRAVPAGTAALYGQTPTFGDGEWFSATMVGDEVTVGPRVERLRMCARSLWEGAEASKRAQANAGTLWGWAAWVSGHTPEARGALVAVLDAQPQHSAAGLLLQVMDFRRTQGL